MDRTFEFQPPANGRLARALYTPVGDALHGQLTGRLDVRREIAAAGLPGPIAGLIYTIVRRTRLWRREKIDVARELAAHFSDGLAAGHSPEKLAADFGTPETAANLIRQAKRRGRPLYWQAWWYASRMLLAVLGVCLLGYGVLAARYYWSAPNIARNYWNEINAARKTGEADRAWPLYRNAYFKLDDKDANLIGEHLLVTPESKHWQPLITALERQQEPLKLAREAAGKPHMGVLLGDAADSAAADAAGKPNFRADVPLASENRALIEIPLQFLQPLRELARLLAADARRAAATGDSATAMADINALLSMSEQIFAPQATLVEQLVGIAIFGMTVEVLERILVEAPAAFDEAQLGDLAHRLAAWRNGQIHTDLAGERAYFDDLLQRIYTDDGHGDGRLTPEGTRVLHNLIDSAPPALNPDQSFAQLLGPGLSAIVGGRAENRELYVSLLDEMIAAHQGPAWEWNYEATHASDNRLKQLAGDLTGKLRYFLTMVLIPGLGGVFSADQRVIQERDAAEVAIALALWHRRHGDWPQSLDQLVPELLPAVPADRFDGKPLRYTVKDGKPVLYSIGFDRDDDGGVPSDPPHNAISYYGALDPNAEPRFVAEANNGDWIFFPRAPEPEEDQPE